MAVPWLAIATLAGSLFGGNKGAEQAGQLSAEQREILQRISGWQEQYGPAALEQMWARTQDVYRTPAEVSEFQRMRQDIEGAYRPVTGQLLQGLSSRGMLTAPGSQAGRSAFALDRARSGDVGRFFMGLAANRGNEQERRMGAFVNMLQGLTGSGTQIAGAFQQPINTFANLAQQQGANIGGALGGLANLLQMQQFQQPGLPGPNINIPTPGFRQPTVGRFV